MHSRLSPHVPLTLPILQALSEGTGTEVAPGSITSASSTAQALNNGQAEKVQAISIANAAAFSEIKESTASALATAVAQVCGGGAAQAQADAVAEAVSTVRPSKRVAMQHRAGLDPQA